MFEEGKVEVNVKRVWNNDKRLTTWKIESAWIVQSISWFEKKLFDEMVKFPLTDLSATNNW